jgi:hypothetical protein
LQAVFEKVQNLLTREILMLKPLETDLLKKADPAPQTKLYERIYQGKSTHRLGKKRELALAIGRKQRFCLGIRTDPSSEDHSC